MLCDPAGDELHVEGPVALCTGDLGHRDPEDRLEADPCANIIVEAGDLDRLGLVVFMALSPQTTRPRTLLTEQMLVVTRGANWIGVGMQTPLAPGRRPIAAATTRLPPNRPHPGLLVVGGDSKGLFRSRHHQPFTPSQLTDLNSRVTAQEVTSSTLPLRPVHWLESRHGGKTFKSCHWDLSQNVSFWPSIQWQQEQPFHIT